MAKMLMGKAALTVIRLSNGTRANIAAGRAVPESIDPDDARRLIDEGFLEEVEIIDEVLDDGELFEEIAEDQDPTDVDDDEEEEEELEDLTPEQREQLDAFLAGNVGDILDKVGDDAEIAAALLKLEQEADKPRTTLVSGLQEVLDADAAAKADGQTS